MSIIESVQDLENLVANELPEGLHLEFKERINTKGDRAASFIGEVCAFANSQGGQIVIGVKEKNGAADEILGVSESNPDGKCLQIAQLLDSHLEPRLPEINIYSILLPNKHHVFVVNVPKGFYGPYRVKLNREFYLRRSAGKVPMEYAEIRNHCMNAGTIFERITDWLRVRTERIDSRDFPRKVVNAPVLSLHVIPVAAFENIGGLQISLKDIWGETDLRFAPDFRGSYDTEYNVEGRCSYSLSSTGNTRRYCQLFREGFVEMVTAYPPFNEKKYIPSLAIQKSCHQLLRAYLGQLGEIGARHPFVVSIAMTGIKDYDLGVSGDMIDHRYSTPLIPNRGIRPTPIIIENSDQDVFASTLPIFDQIWNAFGYPWCPHRSVEALDR